MTFQTLRTGLLVAAVTACGASTAQAQEIVVGSSLPFAGPFASYGETIRDGYQLAVDDINAKGGVSLGGKNHKIKLLILDNKGDPTQVSAQARKLVQSEKAVMLCRTVCTQIAIELDEPANIAPGDRLSPRVAA